jgi:hypothetical protein
MDTPPPNPAPPNPLPWSWVTERLERNRNYWLCTTRPDGRPHTAPVWGVWLDDTLVFSTGRASVKGRNLAYSPSVAVHLESGDEVVTLEGAVAEIPYAELPTPANPAYTGKYGADPTLGPFRLDMFPPEEAAVWSLAPERVLAWTEAEFESTQSRWTFGTDVRSGA